MNTYVYIHIFYIYTHICLYIYAYILALHNRRDNLQKKKPIDAAATPARSCPSPKGRPKLPPNRHRAAACPSPAFLARSPSPRGQLGFQKKDSVSIQVFAFSGYRPFDVVGFFNEGDNSEHCREEELVSCCQNWNIGMFIRPPIFNIPSIPFSGISF